MPILSLLIIIVVVIAVVLLVVKSGFLAPKATCAICGKEIGLNRFKIGKTLDGKQIWKCPECTKKGGLIEIDYKTGKAKFIEAKDTEVRKKCNVCGHLYCYNFNDLEANRKKLKSAALDSVVAAGQAIGGSATASAVNSSNAQNTMNGVIDYNKCPHCGSVDVKELTKEEWTVEQAKTHSTSAPVTSSADELKKFKELLDTGVITQEEFDAKKKQLLGL